MRKLRLVAAAALMAVCTGAFAQFSNSSSSSSSTAGASDGWNTVYLQWNPITFAPDKGDNTGFTGFSAGYNKAFSVSSSAPLYVEAGIGLQYMFHSEDMDEFAWYFQDEDGDDRSYYGEADNTLKYSMLSFKVPVSFMYKWNIPNSSVALAPFVGLDLRFNVLAQEKISFDDSGDQEDFDDAADEYGFDDSHNLFSKDDMGSKDATWKRFQIGWHSGVNAYFGKFLVGVSYGSDFSEIAKKCKLHHASFTLGYTF